MAHRKRSDLDDTPRRKSDMDGPKKKTEWPSPRRITSFDATTAKKYEGRSRKVSSLETPLETSRKSSGNESPSRKASSLDSSSGHASRKASAFERQRSRKISSITRDRSGSGRGRREGTIVPPWIIDPQYFQTLSPKEQEEYLR